MAVNKVSVSAFVLLVVATIAYARPDAIDESSAGALGQTTGRFCSHCECWQSGRDTICFRADEKVGSCPFVCDGSPWTCSCDESSTCRCVYQVDTCNPTACPRAMMTLPEMAAAAEEI